MILANKLPRKIRKKRDKKRPIKCPTATYFLFGMDLILDAADLK